MTVGGSGTDFPDTGTVLAERWNGQSWSVQSMPPLRGGRSEFLEVSCGSVRFCVATGMLVHRSSLSSDFRAIVGIWNGARWTVSVRAKLVPSSGSVSCTSRRFCVLTGGSQPVAWNGSRWSVMRVARGAFSYMGPVSCVSASACVAIAFKRSSVGSSPVASERWNGKMWSVMAASIPDGSSLLEASPGPADALSCASMKACVAILPTGDGGWVALKWDGRSWASAPPSLFRGLDLSQDVLLDGVTCSSATACVLVGSFYPFGTIAQTGFATGLASPHPPLVADPGSVESYALISVTCTTATCMAVGDYTNATGAVQTLAEQYR